MSLCSSAYQKWAYRQILFLLASAFFLIFIYPKTGLDQRLIAPYFDAVNQQFSLKHHWILESVLHTALKNSLIFIAIATLLISLVGRIYAPLKVHHQPLLGVFLLMLISTLAITILKQTSVHACPNDLLQYGGNLPYLSLFDARPIGMEMGKCFPGGHASGGFALMAFYVVYRDSEPKFARAMLLIGLGLGFVMGWAQMMRGEHFLSHNLWSAWVVWAICLSCQALLFILTAYLTQTKTRK